MLLGGSEEVIIPAKACQEVVDVDVAGFFAHLIYAHPSCFEDFLSVYDGG